MIGNYGDFVFESKVYKLLLEGKFEFDNKFLNILKTISKENKLGNSIYNYVTKGIEIPDENLKQNYISIVPDKEDTISFIAQSKYNANVQKNAEDINPFNTKGRSEVKVGRFLKSICTIGEIKHTDKEMEDLVNLFKSLNVDESEHFEIVEGNNIKDWYLDTNYYELSGELGNSCMRYSKCQDYLKIYTENPEKCKLLILVKTVIDGSKKERKLLGRALVWKLDESPTECDTFLDRIYTIKNSDKNKFLRYAQDNGWMTKSQSSSRASEPIWVNYNGKDIKGKLSVKLNGNFRKYPFVDTLSFLNKNKNEISNVGFIKGWDMSTTNGGKETCSNCNGTGYTICYDCGDSGLYECPDCYGVGKVGDICPVCNGNAYIECDDCEGKGTIVNKKGKESKCKTCEGEGSLECKNCDDGEVFYKCELCNGKKKVKCDVCSGGKSKETCPDCIGILK